MKYKILLFDADDTLYDYDKAETFALRKMFEHFNIEYKEDYRGVYKKINTQMWIDFEKGLISQDRLKVERFEKLLYEIGEKGVEGDFGGVYQDYLAQGDFLFDESIDIIDKLSKNYRLAIITNGLLRVQENRIRKHPIAKYFEEIVISDEINMRKPNTDIFEYTLKKMNFFDKSKILMIGDSLGSDILGGINYGIDTCYINLHKKENKSDIKGTYEISHIRDIKKVLI